MLTDPQAPTYDGATISLPRIEQGNRKAAYISSDEKHRLDVSHADSGNRVRSLTKWTITLPVDLDDPLIKDSASLQIVLDRPKTGIGLGDLEKLRAALVAWYSSANFAKLFGQES